MSLADLYALVAAGVAAGVTCGLAFVALTLFYGRR